MDAIRSALAGRGLELPQPPKPGGAYDPVRMLGGVAYVAVQLPFAGGKPAFVGRLGRELTTEDGRRAAELTALNVLAQIDRHVGFERVAGLNHVDALMQASGEWDEMPAVLDGASTLFLDVLGDAGRHTRSLAGVERLPRNVPITLTVSLTVRP